MYALKLKQSYGLVAFHEEESLLMHQKRYGSQKTNDWSQGLPSFKKTFAKEAPQKRQLLLKSLQAVEKLKKQRLDEVFAKEEFNIQIMVSHQFSVIRFNTEIPLVKAENTSNHIKNLKNIAINKFILNVIKNSVSMEF